MGRILKYKKFDSDGNQILEQFTNYYRAKTPLGDEVVISKKKNGKVPVPKLIAAGKQLAQLKGARTNGFDKRPQDTRKGNAGSRLTKIQKQLADADVSWKINQRECLRVYMAMADTEIYNLLVAWKVKTKDQVLRDHDYYVDDVDVANVGTEKPTMTQLTCLRMVLQAQIDPKFALQVLTMLEGRPATVAEMSATKEKEKEAPKEKKSEVDIALAKMKQAALSDTSDFELPNLDELSDKKVSVKEAVEVNPEIAELSGEDLLKSFMGDTNA